MKLTLKTKFFENFLKSKILLGFVILLFVAKISLSLTQINFPGNAFFADITKSELLLMLNQTRNSLGLNALKENTQLGQAAELKAQDMISNGYFNHTSPSGISPWHWFSEAGYNYKYAGENLAIGFYESKEVYRAWLDSQSHKDNIISPYYSEVGTAIASDPNNNGAIIVVQLFGTQKTAASSPAAKTQTATSQTQPAGNAEQETIEIQPTTVGNAVSVSENTQTTAKTEVESKVLSSSIAIQNPTGSEINNFYSKILNFILTSGQNILQYIIYGLLAAAVCAFVYVSSHSIESQINSGTALSGLTVIMILIASSLANADLIATIMPHQIII